MSLKRPSTPLLRFCTLTAPRTPPADVPVRCEDCGWHGLIPAARLDVLMVTNGALPCGCP